MTTRLIANKYREGKAKRTLKRELKVLEIVKGEANIAVECATWWIAYRLVSFVEGQGNRLLDLLKRVGWRFRYGVSNADLGLDGKTANVLCGHGHHGTPQSSLSQVASMSLFLKGSLSSGSVRCLTAA